MGEVTVSLPMIVTRSLSWDDVRRYLRASGWVERMRVDSEVMWVPGAYGPTAFVPVRKRCWVGAERIVRRGPYEDPAGPVATAVRRIAAHEEAQPGDVLRKIADQKLGPDAGASFKVGPA